MKIAATVHVNGLPDCCDEQAGPARFLRESAALEQLNDAQVDALCSVLGAGDAGELVPKLYRLAAASIVASDENIKSRQEIYLDEAENAWLAKPMMGAGSTLLGTLSRVMRAKRRNLVPGTHD